MNVWRLGTPTSQRDVFMHLLVRTMWSMLAVVVVFLLRRSTNTDMGFYFAILLAFPMWGLIVDLVMLGYPNVKAHHIQVTILIAVVAAAVIVAAVSVSQ